MRSCFPSKACTMLAIVLVCLAIATTVACQVHLGLLGHEHAAPSEHHGPSIPHGMGDMTCLLAVLPSVILLPTLLWILFESLAGFLRLAPPVLLPFIPPKDTMR